ncbi:hypothetical protein C1646_749072 [Rhizophagus diaphanus]|nr:hypothetical protein C1646_749072 [Rhizophagus diaphanus] [Rhizophagus sp. MUCL 43196]
MEFGSLHLETVLIGVPASTTTASLYPDNPAHSIFALLESNLNKVTSKAFNLEEFTGDWKSYYTPNLKQRRNHHQKMKQNDNSKISQKSTNTSQSTNIRSMLRKLGIS